MAAAEKKGGDGIVSAVYKVNLHCPECAREVKKPLKRAKGVQKVEVDLDASKVTVIGAVDGKKIRELIEKKTKKKVEIVSVEAKKDPPGKKETEQAKVITTVIKVPMHCEKCEFDLKRKLVKIKGVRNVKIDSNLQTCTVEGTVESQKLIEYIHKNFSHKHAEIVPEKKKEKEKEKEKEKGKEKKGEEKKEIEVEIEKTVIKEKTKEEKEKSKEGGDGGGVPYFVHCTHPPMLFSDENPNACTMM
ncbi:hypothetical protein ACLOJK_027349 [Asimina triloba]